MDIFDSVYYKPCKNFQRFRGSWPYQTYGQKVILRFLVLLLDFSMIIPQILFFISSKHDVQLIIEFIPAFFITIFHLVEYMTHIIYSDKMLQLLNSIKEDWINTKIDEHLNIIHKYGDVGGKIAVKYASAIGLFVLMYIMSALSPRILDILHPLNESRTFVYLIPTQYMLFDQEKYYMLIFIHQAIFCIMIIASIVATDVSYCVYSHHVCGMFAVLRYRLKSLPYITEYKIRLAHGPLISKEIVDCIKRHKTALWFSDTMKSAHALLLFVVVSIGVLALSVTGVKTISNPGALSETLQSAVLCSGQLVHIYYYCWNSQKILDHSSAIFDAIYDAEWYELLKSTTKLLQFTMLRSTKPCIQTAAKLFPMTLMNFSVIVKTSVSYLTVLRNV